MTQTMQPDHAAAQAAPPIAASSSNLEQLRGLIAQNARRWKVLIILEALGLAVSAPLAYLWLAFAIDNLIHLHMAARVLILLVFLAGTGYLAWALIKRWRELNFTEDQVALAMERQSGGLDNRIINSVQLARGEGSSLRFSQDVIEENIGRLTQIQVQQASRMKPAVVRIGVAFTLILAGLIFYSLSPRHFTNAAQRIFMPVLNIEPIYRTRVAVEPGNVSAEPGSDVHARFTITGVIPQDLQVVQVLKNGRIVDTIRIDQANKSAHYTFKNLQQPISYVVIANDYTSDFFKIDVPTPGQISAMKVDFTYPTYTRLPAKTINTGPGEIQALFGTTAKLHFTLDRPVENAKLVSLPTSKADSAQPPRQEQVSLKKISPTEYQAEVDFIHDQKLHIEGQQAGGKPFSTSTISLTVTSDNMPLAEVSGLSQMTSVLPDSQVPVKVLATDDLGLWKAGLFFTRLKPAADMAGQQQAGPKAPQGRSETSGFDPARDEGWTPIHVWNIADSGKRFEADYKIDIQSMGVAEGEQIAIVFKAHDHDPNRVGRWSYTQPVTLVVGSGDGGFQLVYEQILKSEKELQALVSRQQKLMDETVNWVRQIDLDTTTRWDDDKVRLALRTNSQERSTEQNAIREAAALVAQNIPEQASAIRQTIGMIADAEMIRTIRIFESVPQREVGQAIRAALADSRNTQERTVKMLGQSVEDFKKFRHDWELRNMTSFVKMLGTRQLALRDDSLGATTPDSGRLPEVVQKSGRVRQLKVISLAGLAQSALADVAGRIAELPDEQSELLKPLGVAFGEAAKEIAAPDLAAAMQQAADQVGSGKFAQAAASQLDAGTKLMQIHLKLKAVQDKLALQRMEIAAKEESDAKEQDKIAELEKGITENLLITDPNTKLTHANYKREAGESLGPQTAPPASVDAYDFEALNTDEALNPGKQHYYQTAEKLTLSDKAMRDMSFPNSSNKKANAVKPQIQKDFDDVMGPLIDMADINREEYESYRTQYAGIVDESGDIAPQGGDLSSTSATAATGNQKQPPNNSGGASRSGRVGGRAFGQNVDDTTKNEKGRDEALDGDEFTTRVAGSMKEGEGEPQEPTTGYGGKHINSDNTMFSTKDSGQFREEAVNNMGKPQDTHKIVERMGAAGKFTPGMLDKMLDMTSNTQQVIERVKVVKKELNNLYLPTDELDDVLEKLEINLDRMQTNPDPELFRVQAATLERLVSIARIIDQGQASFQPSLPRKQAVRGSVLDEPSPPTIPGYEDAVSVYFKTLSEAR